jgi:hypothetical protein
MPDHATTDTRAKAATWSFVALLGLLAVTAFASMHHARPNAALTQAVFGTTN